MATKTLDFVATKYYSISLKTNKTEVIKFRVTKDEKKLLDSLAKELDSSLSHTLRVAAIIKFLLRGNIEAAKELQKSAKKFSFKIHDDGTIEIKGAKITRHEGEKK